jgi:UDP-N-acetylmuramoyl-tripeptide--D-alanyl-D-alanine ligase
LLCEREIPEPAGPYVLVGSTLEALRTLAAAYRKMFDIPIIGITGSVGKTTGKEMIAAALGSTLNVLRTPGNLNNQIGVPLTLLSLDETHEVAVIEMGINHFGDMSVLTQMVMPDIMILTKIGYAHLDNLGDLDGVLKAKTEVFDFVEKNAIAVFNGDDERLWGYDPKIKKITYGFDKRNDYRAENMHVSGTDSVSFRARAGQESFEIKIPGFGAHLTMAAMAAVAAGRLLGIKNEDIAKGLTTYAPVGGRANVSHTGYITLINDSYNANPSSVRAALESISVLTGRRVAILGDMINLGELGDEMHEEIGICAKHTGIDSLICNGPQAEFIYNAFIAEGGTEARYFKSKEELIKELPALIQKDDNVLVKASNGMKFDEVAEFLKSLR